MSRGGRRYGWKAREGKHRWTVSGVWLSSHGVRSGDWERTVECYGRADAEAAGVRLANGWQVSGHLVAVATCVKLAWLDTAA